MAATKGTTLAVITAMKVVYEDMTDLAENELDTFRFVAGRMTLGGEDVVCVIARQAVAKDLTLLVESRGGTVHNVSDEIQTWLDKA